MSEISDLLTKIGNEELGRVVGDLSQEQISQLTYMTRAAFAGRRFDVAGFRDFHYCLFGREIPAHTEGWVEGLFEAHEQGKGVMLEGFRGSIKSTLMMTFSLFLIGHRPWGSGLLVGANDTSAAKLSSAMAALIEYAPGWRACFPSVVPDMERGWGERGYFVWDTTYSKAPIGGKSYSDWIELCISDHLRDPSFVALGVHSGDIVGMHPSTFVLLDDIHNRDNTISNKEIESVKGSLRANILPTMSTEHRPFMGVAYTPWTESDAYADLKRSGSFVCISTPVYTVDENKVRTYAWPERWNDAEVERWIAEVGLIEFSRMFLLDLSAGKGVALKYYGYDQSLINYDLPMVGGADPVNVMSSRDGAHRSHFALAYVAKLPQGGAVIVDGVLEQCSELEAEGYIKRAQTMFPGWMHTSIENVGGGALFIQVVRRNPSIKIIDSDLSGFLKRGGRIRSKKDRILLEMHPWFENGVVRVSTADTPFLNAFRRLMENFFILDPTSLEFDVGDSVYHALKSIPDVLHIEAPEIALGTIAQSPKNPFNALGHKHGG